MKICIQLLSLLTVIQIRIQMLLHFNYANFSFDAGSSVCHILWTIPSKTSSCADAVSLLAQPKATRSHQWIQRAAVHRSVSLNVTFAALSALELSQGSIYLPFFSFFSSPNCQSPVSFPGPAWNPIHCQHIECHNAINKPAVKVNWLLGYIQAKNCDT